MLRDGEVVTEESMKARWRFFVKFATSHVKSRSLRGRERRSLISDCVFSLQLFLAIAFALAHSDMS